MKAGVTYIYIYVLFCAVRFVFSLTGVWARPEIDFLFVFILLFWDQAGHKICSWGPVPRLMVGGGGFAPPPLPQHLSFVGGRHAEACGGRLHPHPLHFVVGGLLPPPPLHTHTHTHKHTRARARAGEPWWCPKKRVQLKLRRGRHPA